VAEIAARIADELSSYLDAPVRRVAALEHICEPMLRNLRRHPAQVADVLKAITELHSY